MKVEYFTTMGSKRKFWRFILNRDHLLITIGAFILLGLLYFVTFNISFLNPVANALKAFSVTDLFFDIQHYGKSEESDSIAIVDISEVESRGDVAAVIERVALSNPACIGVDAIFEGLRSDTEGNAYLMEVADAYKDIIVFTSKLTDYDSKAGGFTSSVHSFFVDSLSVCEGFANLKNNLDNLPVRELAVRSNLGQDAVLSFPAALVEKYSGHSLENNLEDLLINYRNVNFRVVPPDDIEEYSDFLEGKIVLLGGVKEERDMHTSPVGKIPGVVIQAHSLDTLLGTKVRSLPSWANWILAFVLCWLFQVTVEAVVSKAINSRRVVPATFLRESCILSGIMFFVWSVVISYIAFLIFSKRGFCFDIAIILMMFALTLESRKLYRSSIIALSKRYSCRFLEKSIYT